jgi:transcriptional regulator of heat shock response
MPEFYDINVTRQVLTLIEEVQLLEDIFNHAASENPVQVVYGQELGNKNLEPVGIVFFSCRAGNQQCRLGIVGSTRFEYQYVVPMMRYFRGLIEEMTT